MPKKEQIESGKAVLRLRLGACLTAPTKRMIADLHAVTARCNVARNAMARAWQRWREDNPDWKPGVGVSKKTGREYVKNEPMPKKIGDGDDGISGSTYLYRRARLVVPEVSSTVISMCAQEVYSRLAANMPWNHGGQAKYRWQAIEGNEVNLETYRGLAIPIHNRDAAFCYCGDASRDIKDPRIAEMGKSSAVLRFGLFSQLSGREHTDYICRVEVRQLSQGNRRLLQHIARRKWKLCDSKLVWDDGWYFNLTYDQPLRDYGLNKKNVATLTLCGAEESQPLRVGCGHARPWDLGHARTMEAENNRLDQRRKALRHEHGTNGHGRGRVERYIKPITRGLRFLMKRFQENLVREVLKYCLRNDCGSIHYREPTMPLREKSWFAKRKLPFDWTGFLARLGHKCKLHGIELQTERMGTGEHFSERRGDRPNPGNLSEVTKPKPSSGNGNGHHAKGLSANGKAVGSRGKARKVAKT